jgi:twitching motility two-component system response regulator PilH
VKGQQTIVIIDDDPDFIEYARIVLESAAYSVLTATNAADGLALVRESRPDLIVTDLMMSYTLEGASVTREIRADPELCQTPVLVITAIARRPDADLFPEGAQPAPEGFLTKPVTPGDLLASVDRCLTSDSACRLI